MDTVWQNELELIFTSYRNELKAAEQKQKPTSGLFGFGHSIKDDACHDRFDERIQALVSEVVGAISSNDAAELVQSLITESERFHYPISAEWMLIAIQRHILPLIPRLSPADAKAISQKYAQRYLPWNRLPAQKQVLAELKRRSKE